MRGEEGVGGRAKNNLMDQLFQAPSPGFKTRSRWRKAGETHGCTVQRLIIDSDRRVEAEQKVEERRWRGGREVVSRALSEPQSSQTGEKSSFSWRRSSCVERAQNGHLKFRGRARVRIKGISSPASAFPSFPLRKGCRLGPFSRLPTS